MDHATLSELWGHQAWADAEHWRALEARAGALDDPSIRERLHHVQLTELAFLCIAQGFPIVPTRLTDYSSMSALKHEARRTHEEAAAFLETTGRARLQERVAIPWFRDPPITISVAEALWQAAMHSHHHRAQNATRLRELGGEPPLTDIIVWWWKGRPAPHWE